MLLYITFNPVTSHILLYFPKIICYNSAGKHIWNIILFLSYIIVLQHLLFKKQKFIVDYHSTGLSSLFIG